MDARTHSCIGSLAAHVARVGCAGTHSARPDEYGRALALGRRPILESWQTRRIVSCCEHGDAFLTTPAPARTARPPQFNGHKKLYTASGDCAATVLLSSPRVAAFVRLRAASDCLPKASEVLNAPLKLGAPFGCISTFHVRPLPHPSLLAAAPMMS